MFGLFGSSSKDNHSSNFDNDDFDPDGVLSAAINPKELLAEENGKVDLDFDKRGLVEEEPEEEIDTEDVEEKYEEVVYIGKQGPLYKENEDALNKQQPYSLVWVALYNGHLVYSSELSANMIKTMTKPTDNTKLISLGYVDINSETEVKMRFKEKPDPTNSTNLKKFCFQVKEHDTNLILAAETEEDRESWMSILREAVSGKMHILKNCKVIIDPYNDEDYYSSLTTSNSPNSSPMHNNKIDTFLSMSTSTKSNRKKGGSLLGATISNTAIDYPRKIGYLKKMSTRTKAFGMKSIKKRWFRLEGGKLMYYDDERMNISNLKGTIDLKGAEIVPEPDNLFIFGLKIKNGKFMKFEAVTMKIALEWKDLLSETITLLDSKSNSNNIFNSVLDENYITSERRFNVHSNLDNMQSTNSNSAATYNNRSSAVKKSTDKSADSKKSQSTFGFFFSTNDEGEDENSDEDVPVHVKHKKVNKKHKMSVQTENLLKECLEHHFLFKMIHNQDFLIDRFKEKVTTVGEIIIWEGAVAEDLFYVLESGSCDIIKGNKLISKIHGGTSFGEMALILNNSSRTATFRSSQVCRLWTLRRCDLRELLRQQEEELFQKKINFLSQVTLFEKLTAASIEKIADVMVLRHYEQGEKIIRQGDAGDAFYMISKGRVTVQQSGLFSGAVELVKLGPGKYFGELALIEDAPRKATVVALESVSCWTVDRENFLNIFGSMDDALNESIGLNMLRQVKLLDPLGELQLMTLAKRLSSCKYSEEDVIIQQGDVGDCFYMISSGEVTVTVNHMQVAILGAGAFFGEVSLLSNERRTATVAASTETTCLLLTRNDFNELLGPVVDVIKAEANARKQSSNASSPSSSPTIRGKSINDSPSAIYLLRNSLFGANTERRGTQVNRSANALFAHSTDLFQMDQLDKIRVLGVGTFGTTYLVQHVVTDKSYAIKVVHKQTISLLKLEENLFHERDIMLLLTDCQYVAALYATLQDNHSLYMIQQYVHGGDLFNLLYSKKFPATKLGGLPIPQVAFYASNLFAAVSQIHQQEIVHRDLRLENLVIDRMGYIKIIDFGSSKRLPVGERTFTICGAPECLPPEMVLSRGHNKAVDFWSIGIILYELLTRKSPFYHENMVMIYQNIMESEEFLEVNMDPHFDNKGKSMVTGLLRHNPFMRLGMLHNGMEDIWNHSFLKGISLDQLENRKIVASYVPEEDTDAHERTDLDVIDLIEDEDDIPKYTGNFDFNQF